MVLYFVFLLVTYLSIADNFNLLNATLPLLRSLFLFREKHKNLNLIRQKCSDDTPSFSVFVSHQRLFAKYFSKITDFCRLIGFKKNRSPQEGTLQKIANFLGFSSQ